MRNKNIQRMGEENFDLCIVGGGITGAGVARDAASRGMKVCLIEQNDFASGTSSRSSKLIHGGIRYLENLEFGLVFEALNERHVLFQIAPHLVHPLTFILPVYKGGRVGMFKMGLGMWLYDMLALFHAPKFHERLSTFSTMYELPQLQEKNLAGSYLYSDAYMDDDRLVVETLRSAENYGAIAANYCQVGKADISAQGKIQALHIHDSFNGKDFTIRAKHFVSTVGPWTDILGQNLFNDWQKILRPSKGIHLVIPAAKIPTTSAVVMATENDSRIIFAIPRGEIVIIGTTDTDYKEDPIDVKTNIEDVDYLLKIVNGYFPGAALEKSDIISSYSGVRPLVADGSSTESKTSREHLIKHTPHNITFVAGGKYTTYRRMARDIVETVLREEFSMEQKVQYARNQTRDPINPNVTPEKLSSSISRSEIWARDYGISKEDAKLLAIRHGDDGLQMIEEASQKGLKEIWVIEAYFAVKNSQCLHLRDFMLRRSPLYLTRHDHGASVIESIIRVMKIELSWSDEKVKIERELYQAHIHREMGWKTGQ